MSYVVFTTVADKIANAFKHTVAPLMTETIQVLATSYIFFTKDLNKDHRPLPVLTITSKQSVIADGRLSKDLNLLNQSPIGASIYSFKFLQLKMSLKNLKAFKPKSFIGNPFSILAPLTNFSFMSEGERL